MNDSILRCCPDIKVSKGDMENCCNQKTARPQPDSKSCPVCGRQGQNVPLTRGQVKVGWQNGARTYSDVVKAAGVEQERCNCQYENPAGKCCSGTIQGYLDELDLLHIDSCCSPSSNDTCT